MMMTMTMTMTNMGDDGDDDHEEEEAEDDNDRRPSSSAQSSALQEHPGSACRRFATSGASAFTQRRSMTARMDLACVNG